MVAIAVRCEGTPADGWTCTVTVRESGADLSTHRVAVAAKDLERLAPGATEPTVLVEQSFRFLLERESPRSILSAFDLLDIARYFPEYVAELAGRMRDLG
jgi:hypothetical protein